MRYLITAFVGGMLWAGAAAAASVNVNEAEPERLAQALDGIGEVKAQAIVEHREENGRFQSVDGLTAVDGIGPKTLEDIRDDVSLGESESETESGSES